MTPPQDPQPQGSTASSSTLRLLHRLVAVEPGEAFPMLLGSSFYFFLFSSYFILRPIRDAMGVAAGTSQLPWLFAGTLAAMLVCNPR